MATDLAPHQSCSIPSISPSHPRAAAPRREPSSAKLLLACWEITTIFIKSLRGLFKNFSSQRNSFQRGFGSTAGISRNVCCSFPPPLCTVGQAAAVVQEDQPSRSPTTLPSRMPAPAQPLQRHTGTAALSLPAGEGGGNKRHSRGICQAHPFPSAWRSPFQSLKTRKQPFSYLETRPWWHMQIGWDAEGYPLSLYIP